MRTSQNGIDLIKRFEGCMLTAYDIGDGMITIGYGYAESKQGTKMVAGVTTWTQERADKQLLESIRWHEQEISTFFEREFNQNQFDALSSFSYNLGRYIFLVDKWNPRATDKEITDLMLRYVNPPQYREGLLRRRQAEVELFNRPVAGIQTQAPTPIKKVEESEVKMIRVGATHYLVHSSGVSKLNTTEDITVANRAYGLNGATEAWNQREVDVLMAIHRRANQTSLI